MRSLAALMLLAGIWLILAPYVLGYRGAAATNDLILGVAVVLIARAVLGARREVRREALPATPRGAAGDGMADMVRTLAQIPGAQRQTMMDERLRMFAGMPEGQRSQAMRAMMEAVLRLPDDQLATLVATRVRLLSEYPDHIRMTLMQTHMNLLQGFPERERQREMQFTMRAVGQLPAEKRTPFEQMIQAM